MFDISRNQIGFLRFSFFRNDLVKQRIQIQSFDDKTTHGVALPQSGFLN